MKIISTSQLFPFGVTGYSTEWRKNKAYILPLEEMVIPLSFLCSDYEEYYGCIIMCFITLTEPYTCSNIPTNANILKFILSNGKWVVQHI